MISKPIFILALVFFLLFGVLIGASLRTSQNIENPNNLGNPLNPININLFPKSCEYNGKTYKPGEGFRSDDGCNSCSCENGQVACTMMFCGE